MTDLRRITTGDLDGWAATLRDHANQHPHPPGYRDVLNIADQMESGPYRTWETATDLQEPRMSIEEDRGTASAIDRDFYMIMQFDPRDATLIKFGDTYAASDYNLAESRRDAADAARQAAAKGLPFHYLVIHTTTVATYRPTKG